MASLLFAAANRNSVAQSFTLMTRLFLQLGYEITLKRRASRALLLSSAVALNLIFIYFSCDLTARMTSAPPKISITSFDDVKEQGEQRILTLKTNTY